MNSKTRLFLFFFALLAVLVGVPVWLTWRDVRQENLGRALIVAVKKEDTNGVLPLLKQGADVNAREEPHRNPAMWRLLFDSSLRQGNASSDAPTALLAALEPIDIAKHRFPPENVPLIRALLDKGADVNARDRWGFTALHLAASYGYIRTVRLLLDRGADIQAQDQGGGTPLISAVDCLQRSPARIAIIKLLLERGADANANENGRTALDLTTNLAIVKLLVNKGADVNASKPSDGITPLMLASGAGKAETVKFLLAHKADVRAKDKTGATALTWAQNSRRSDIIKMLTQAGAQKPLTVPPASASSSSAAAQQTVSSATIVNQVEYRVTVSKVWAVPARKGASRVYLSLKLTNHRASDYVFDPNEQFGLRLTSSRGKVFAFIRQGTPPLVPPPPARVKPGASWSASRTGSLTWNGKTLRLSGGAFYSAVWYVDGLQPGRYTFQWEFAKGSVRTPPVAVEIRSRDSRQVR